VVGEVARETKDWLRDYEYTKLHGTTNDEMSTEERAYKWHVLL